MKKIFIVLSVILILTGCKIDKKWFILAEKQPFKVTQAEKKVVSIDVPKELNEKIFDWFKNNLTDWDSPFPPYTYAPNTMLRNDYIKINVFESGLVVNIQDTKGKWNQFEKDLDSERCKWIEEIEILIESRDEPVKHTERTRKNLMKLTWETRSRSTTMN